MIREPASCQRLAGYSGERFLEPIHKLTYLSFSTCQLSSAGKSLARTMDAGVQVIQNTIVFKQPMHPKRLSLRLP